MVTKNVVKEEDKLGCSSSLSVLCLDATECGLRSCSGEVGFVCAKSHQTAPGTSIINFIGIRVVSIV